MKTCLPACSGACVRLFATLDCTLSGSFVHGIPRQEYWSGLPRSPLGDVPNPRIKPTSPALQADSLPSEPPGKSTDNNINIPKCPSGYVISNGERSNAKPGQGGAVAGVEWKEGCGGMLNSLLFLPPAPLFSSFACSSAHLRLEEKPVFFRNCCSWC